MSVLLRLPADAEDVNTAPRTPRARGRVEGPTEMETKEGFAVIPGSSVVGAGHLWPR